MINSSYFPKKHYLSETTGGNLVKKPKGTSRVNYAKIDQLISLFRLNSWDGNLQDLAKLKNHLVAKIPLSNIAALRPLAAKVNCVFQALDRLRDSYHAWPHTQGSHLQTLATTIEEQHRVLEIACELVSLLTIFDIHGPHSDQKLQIEKEIFFIQQFPQDNDWNLRLKVFNYSDQNIRDPLLEKMQKLYHAWEPETAKEEVADLQIQLKKLHQEFLLKAIEQKPSDAKPITLPRKSLPSPVSIYKQAVLFQVIRESKEWLHHCKEINITLKPLDGPQRIKRPPIYEIFSFQKDLEKGSHERTRLVGFLKTGPCPTAGLMEALVWDVAQILGLEDCFAATRFIKFDSYNLQGSVQALIEGILLSKWDPAKLPMNEEKILKAFTAIVVLGLFDAHQNNIFVTKEGLLLFDNTRGLTPPSDTIKWAQSHVILSFICTLLRLPMAQEALTNRSFLIALIDSIEKRLPDLKKYFQNPFMEKRLKNFPENWMDPQLSYDGVSFRLQKLKCGIKESSTLLDIAFHVSPAMKYFSLLCLASKIDHPAMAEVKNNPSKAISMILGTLGTAKNCTLRQLAQNALEKGFNAHLLWKQCIVEKIPYARMVQEILNTTAEQRVQMLKALDHDKQFRLYRMVLAEYENSLIEHKDTTKPKPPTLEKPSHTKENIKPLQSPEKRMDSAFPATEPDRTPEKLMGVMVSSNKATPLTSPKKSPKTGAKAKKRLFQES